MPNTRAYERVLTQRRVIRRLELLHEEQKDLERRMRINRDHMAYMAVRGRDVGLSVRDCAYASGRSKTWVGDQWVEAERREAQEMGPR